MAIRGPFLFARSRLLRSGHSFGVPREENRNGFRQESCAVAAESSEAIVVRAAAEIYSAYIIAGQSVKDGRGKALGVIALSEKPLISPSTTDEAILRVMVRLVLASSAAR